MYTILNSVTNTVMTGFTFVGIGAVIIKVGKFLKIIEENKEYSFKKGFDTIMLESIDDMNTCIESISTITNNFNKVFFIVYDISICNKYIKKDKEDKIIMSDTDKDENNLEVSSDELSDVDKGKTK